MSNTRNLVRHIRRVHHIGKPHVCPDADCHAKFWYKPTYIHHMHIHSNTNIFANVILPTNMYQFDELEEITDESMFHAIVIPGCRNWRQLKQFWADSVKFATWFLFLFIVFFFFLLSFPCFDQEQIW